jgi:hypothetical protein
MADQTFYPKLVRHVCIYHIRKYLHDTLESNSKKQHDLMRNTWMPECTSEGEALNSVAHLIFLVPTTTLSNYSVSIFTVSRSTRTMGNPHFGWSARSSVG